MLNEPTSQPLTAARRSAGVSGFCSGRIEGLLEEDGVKTLGLLWKDDLSGGLEHEALQRRLDAADRRARLAPVFLHFSREPGAEEPDDGLSRGDEAVAGAPGGPHGENGVTH